MKTTLLLLPFLIGFLVLEIILRQIPNDYKFKASYLDQNASKIECLILGSSHSFFGANPAYFSKNTFNASHVSQSIDYDYEILKTYSHKFKKLNTIYLPMSSFTLYEKLKNIDEYWRCKMYYRSYGIKKDFTTKDYFESTGDLKINITKATDYVFKKKDNRISSKLGWAKTYKSENAKDLIETGKIAAQRHYYDIGSQTSKLEFIDNKTILKDIIKWSKLKDINVVLFTPPAYKSYRENMNKEQLEMTVRAANNIANTFDNCMYINFMADTSFTAKDFYDADHLSEIGAKKLSGKLNAIHNP
ncbi:hypothetical protein [Algibacter sp. 2305UL17-15]|uniref:hypothetical protein n=1 Tax=Algibacter sp. 2305UL17-15 TaxID=3231268 RepID=UPI0034592310